MPLVVLQPSEAFVTLLAVEWLLTGVRTQMSPHILGLNKGPRTVGTGKGALFAVGVLVAY